MEWRDTIAGRLIQADWLQENGLPHDPLRLFVTLAQAGGSGYPEGYGDGDGEGDGYWLGHGNGNGSNGKDIGNGDGFGKGPYRGRYNDGNGYSGVHANSYPYESDGGGYGGIELLGLSTMNNGAVYVFVLTHGHVRVGRLAGWEDGSLSLRIDGGSVVRRWGTTKGLGQLAAEGPLPETVLDPLPDGVLLQRIALIEAIPCDPAAWASLFPPL